MKKIVKIKDKVEKMDVAGQGCMDDCKWTRWAGNRNSNEGCTKYTGSNARWTTSF